MAGAPQLLRAGEVFLDARGQGRALRVAWHSESGVVVLSLWRENACVATFRLPVDEVPELIDSLRAGLAHAYADTRRCSVEDVRDAG
jgi:hypothetical protein